MSLKMLAVIAVVKKMDTDVEECLCRRMHYLVMKGHDDSAGRYKQAWMSRQYEVALERLGRLPKDVEDLIYSVI